MNNRIYDFSIMDKAVKDLKDLKDYFDKKNIIHRMNKIKRIWKNKKDTTELI